jgi:hypothetical protein
MAETEKCLNSFGATSTVFEIPVVTTFPKSSKISSLKKIES